MQRNDIASCSSSFLLTTALMRLLLLSHAGLHTIVLMLVLMLFRSDAGSHTNFLLGHKILSALQMKEPLIYIVEAGRSLGNRFREHASTRQ